jgi:ribosome-associated protein
LCNQFHFRIAGAKVLLFRKLPKFFLTFLLKTSKKGVFWPFMPMFQGLQSLKNNYFQDNRKIMINFAAHYNKYIIRLLQMEQMNALVQTIIKGIQEKKGTGIVVADLNGIEGTICRYFVICQGNSPAQVEAITESVGDMARIELKEKPAHVVGLENAQWVAMDYTDVLVHIFLPDVREYYDLEHLWEDAVLNYIPDLD